MKQEFHMYYVTACIILQCCLYLHANSGYISLYLYLNMDQPCCQKKIIKTSKTTTERKGWSPEAGTSARYDLMLMAAARPHPHGVIDGNL